MKIHFPHIRTLAAILLVSLSSCADNLDLDPEQDLTPEDAIATEANIQNLLVGAYDIAGENEIYCGQLYLAAELIPNSGELFWRGTFSEPAEFNRKQITTNNTFVEEFWTFGYAAINQTNIVLDNLGIISTDEERDRIQGEALFLRGALFFDLARYYAQPYLAGQANSQAGVPLVLDPVLDPSQITFPERNTVEEVYNQVISDLTTAANLLPEKNSFFADRYAALALLARVYLQQGNYTAARDAANEVLTSSGHTLTSSYADAFNNDEDSPEDIFSWQITTQDGLNDMNTFWATRAFGGRSLTADVTVEEPFFDLFDGADDRASFFYSGNQTLCSSKWQSQFANVPFLRIAEMHLIRAECNFRLGSSLGLDPLSEINALRSRSNAAPLGSLSLEEILRERRRELAFEGFRIHDIKRTQGNIDGLPYDANNLVFPIPRREIDANPNLTQNPGYSE